MYCVYAGEYANEKAAKKDRNKIIGVPYLFHIDNHYSYKVYSGSDKDAINSIAQKYRAIGFTVKIKQQ